MAKSPLQAAAHDEHHVVPTFTYIKVLVALAALMGITIAASYIDLPAIGPFSGTFVNQTVALVIAVMKAFLVVWIFMGVKWGTKLTRLWALTGFVWFFLLGLVLIDYPMRAFEKTEGWEGMPESALPRETLPPGKVIEQPENEINLRPRG